MNITLDWIKKPTGCLKLLTLVINIVCVALLAKYGIIGREGMTPQEAFRQALFIITTTAGFLMADLLFILGYCIDNAHGKLPHQELCASLAAAVMNLAAGGITIHNVILFESKLIPIGPEQSPYLLGIKSYGSLCIINGAVYVIHLAFVLKLRLSSSGILYQRDVD